MEYFITGGCGFIGSHLAEELVKRDETVVIYDNLSSGYERNIAHIRDKCLFIQGDIRDYQLLTDSMRGAAYVFHEAALVSVFDSVMYALYSMSIQIFCCLIIRLYIATFSSSPSICCFCASVVSRKCFSLSFINKPLLLHEL